MTMTVAESRRPTNVSLREDLVARAKEFDLNISRIAKEALDRAIRAAAGDRWLTENRSAIEIHNAWIERRGLPLRPGWPEQWRVSTSTATGSGRTSPSC